jgi:hypothetical protein
LKSNAKSDANLGVSGVFYQSNNYINNRPQAPWVLNRAAANIAGEAFKIPFARQSYAVNLFTLTFSLAQAPSCAMSANQANCVLENWGKRKVCNGKQRRQ